MKKVLKNPIFTFILGFVIAVGMTTVFAYSYFAPDVGYTPRDNTWNVDNVKSAIDDLRSRTYISLNSSVGWTYYNGPGYKDGAGAAENVISSLEIGKEYILNILGGMEVNGFISTINVSITGATCRRTDFKADYCSNKLSNGKYAEWYSATYYCKPTATSATIRVTNSNNYWMWFYTNATKIYN